MKIDYRPHRAGWHRLYGCGVCGGEWTTKNNAIVCGHCGHRKWVQRIDVPPSDSKENKTDADDPSTEP